LNLKKINTDFLINTAGTVIVTILCTNLLYKYALGDQIESLPIIMKNANPELFSNDFIVNSIYNEGPRKLYGIIFGFLSSIISLEILAYLVVLVSNFITVFFTYKTLKFFTGDIKQEVHLIILSGVLLLAYTYPLGSGTVVASKMMIPDTLIKPFIFSGFYYLLRKNIFASTLPLAFLAFIHPLNGLVFFWGYWFMFIIFYGLKAKHKLRLNMLWTLIGGIAISILVVKVLKPESHIAFDKYYYILAQFRHPHHYIPSSFKLIDWFSFVSAVTSIFIVVNIKRFFPKQVKYLLSFIIVSFVALAFFGFVFSEIWPIKLMITVQPFRYFILLKWLYLIISISFVVVQFTSGAMNKFQFALALFCIPPAISFLFFLVIPGDRQKWWIASIISLMFYFLFVPFELIAGLLLLLIVLYISFISLKASFLMAFVFGVLLFFARPILQNLPEKEMYSRVYAAMPNYTLNQINTNYSDISRKANKMEIPSPVFLVPPDGGFFRLITGHAIVVDFKVFPFIESDMVAWYQRIVDCYNTTDKTGFTAVQGLKENYKSITDENIQSVSKKYSATHAILYTETPSYFPVVDSNEEYKIIAIP